MNAVVGAPRDWVILEDASSVLYAFVLEGVFALRLCLPPAIGWLPGRSWSWSWNQLSGRSCSWNQLSGRSCSWNWNWGWSWPQPATTGASKFAVLMAPITDIVNELLFLK
jgi:hypothetical protein